MKKKDKEIITEAINDIEKWKGDAYFTPSTDPEQCPDGDDIYQALERIKAVVSKENRIVSFLKRLFTRM